MKPCNCDLCQKRAMCEGLFVADTPETFVCSHCIPLVMDPERLDDPTVQVWEEYSDGWLAPIECRMCGDEIPVEVGLGSWRTR